MIGFYINREGKEYKVFDCVLINGTTHYILMETTREITHNKNSIEFKDIADDQKLLLESCQRITTFRRGRL
jgi:hypothetical protein